MRRFAIAAAAVFLPFSAESADLLNDFNFIEEAVSPAPSVVAHLEFSAGWWRREQSVLAGTDTEDALRLEGHGRINLPFAGNWNLELETGGMYRFRDDPQRDNYTIGGYAHLWADFSGFRLGAFGGGDFLRNASDVTVWTGGAEAEVDVGGNLTLGLQGSYSTPDGCGSCDFVYVVGWADFYPTPNTKIGIQGGWFDFVDISGSSFEDWSVWGVAEHRFSGTPLSLFVRAGYESTFDNILQYYSVAGGLRVFFDNNSLTLQEHDYQIPFEYRLPQWSNNFGL